MKRNEQLRKIARLGVAYLIHEDIEGRTETFKGAWEQANSAAEQAVLTTEFEAIVAWLKEKK